MTHETLICDECGEETDENMAEGLLGEAGIETDGQTLCECCAEEALDATRSADADAREMGLYFAEVCQPDDTGDDFLFDDAHDIMEEVPEIPEVRTSSPLFGNRKAA